MHPLFLKTGETSAIFRSIGNLLLIMEQFINLVNICRQMSIFSFKILIGMFMKDVVLEGSRCFTAARTISGGTQLNSNILSGLIFSPILIILGWFLYLLIALWIGSKIWSVPVKLNVTSGISSFFTTLEKKVLNASTISYLSEIILSFSIKIIF